MRVFSVRDAGFGNEPEVLNNLWNGMINMAKGFKRISNLYLFFIGSHEGHFQRSIERWNAELNTDYLEEDWRWKYVQVKFLSINTKHRMMLFNFSADYISLLNK